MNAIASVSKSTNDNRLYEHGIIFSYVVNVYLVLASFLNSNLIKYLQSDVSYTLTLSVHLFYNVYK